MHGIQIVGFHLIVFVVQCIQHVTKMCVKMEALVDSTFLITCVNVLKHTMDHSVRMVSELRSIY